MTLVQPHHPGLPVVPRAAAGELLGSWLLRVAQVYGLDLRDLLDRLEVIAPTIRALPPWCQLHQDHLQCSQLAAALRKSPESIAAMGAPKCDRHWPVELGFCRQCWEDSAATGAPQGWLRRWMHPVALACEKHRSWLEPIATSRLRKVLNPSDIARLPKKDTELSAWERRRESLLIEGALWLQGVVTDQAGHRPPWGKRLRTNSRRSCASWSSS